MQAPRQRLPEQRERGNVVGRDRQFLFPVLLHLLCVSSLQIGVSQSPVYRRLVTALRVFHQECLTDFDFFGRIILVDGLKRFKGGIFFRVYRRRNVQSKRRNIRSFRFVALLRRGLALACLVIM